MDGRSIFLLTFLLFSPRAFATENSVSDQVEFTIDDKVLHYSMTDNPPADSPVVLAQKEDLLGALDLKAFVEDLGRVGKYVIKVAYNGIGAAGPRFQDLQNEVQELGFDISTLCDKSAVTIAKFKTTTTTVLYELKSAYQFLLDGREDMAVLSFSTLAKLAGKMAKAAEKLKEEFERQESKVRETLGHTNTRRGEEGRKIIDLRMKQQETEENIKVQETLIKEHAKLEAEAQAERLRYERKEDKAISAKTSFLGRLGNAITSHYGLGNLFGEDEGTSARKANKWRQKSIEKLEIEKEQRKYRHAALQEMAGLLHALKTQKKEEEFSDIAVNALHEASGALKQLVVVSKQAVLFWEQLQEHCEVLADDKTQQEIEKYVEKSSSKEERIRYWNSNNFKQAMFLYVSKWVALHSVSTDYLKQIKLTQRELYDHIKENPTYEESRQNLPMLVKDFEKDLKSAYDEMERRDSKANKEIAQLKKEEKAEKTEL